VNKRCSKEKGWSCYLFIDGRREMSRFRSFIQSDRCAEIFSKTIFLSIEIVHRLVYAVLQETLNCFSCSAKCTLQRLVFHSAEIGHDVVCQHHVSRLPSSNTNTKTRKLSAAQVFHHRPNPILTSVTSSSSETDKARLQRHAVAHKQKVRQLNLLPGSETNETKTQKRKTL